MNTPTLVLKSPRILFLNTNIYLISKNGLEFQRNIALNSSNTHFMKNGRKSLSKLIPQWFLEVETGKLQFFSTVPEDTLETINSHASITKT